MGSSWLPQEPSRRRSPRARRRRGPRDSRRCGGCARQRFGDDADVELIDAKLARRGRRLRSGRRAQRIARARGGVRDALLGDARHGRGRRVHRQRRGWSRGGGGLARRDARCGRSGDALDRCRLRRGRGERHGRAVGRSRRPRSGDLDPCAGQRTGAASRRRSIRNDRRVERCGGSARCDVVRDGATRGYGRVRCHGGCHLRCSGRSARRVVAGRRRYHGGLRRVVIVAGVCRRERRRCSARRLQHACELGPRSGHDVVEEPAHVTQLRRERRAPRRAGGESAVGAAG